jgi:RNA polymerase sigma factor (sigma-70 family)
MHPVKPRGGREMDTGGFDRIFEEHGPLVWSVIRAAGVPRDDAEDLFMTTWEGVSAALPSFSGRSKLTTWIAGIARRKCVDYLRDKGPEQPASPEEIDQLDAGVSARRIPRGEHTLGPHLRAVAREARVHIARALRALNPMQRTALTLWMEGFNYKTIAETLNRSGDDPVDPNHVGVILVRARASIRKSLRKAGMRAVEDFV